MTFIARWPICGRRSRSKRRARNSGCAKRWKEREAAMHKRFEEWCALAVMGQLAPEAAVALEEHARCCSACKEFLADAGALRGYIEPALLTETVAEATPPEGMRERFLRRAAE